MFSCRASQSCPIFYKRPASGAPLLNITERSTGWLYSGREFNSIDYFLHRSYSLVLKRAFEVTAASEADPFSFPWYENQALMLIMRHRIFPPVAEDAGSN